MSEPTHPTPRPEGPPDRRIRRAWWIFATSFFCLCLIAVLRLALDTRRPIDVVLVGLIVLVGFAAIRHREAVAALEVGRREEAESFARILSSLSRTVSPDAILGAIVDELADATGADHIVIVRRRPDARVLEATLVSARPGVPDSTTLLPIADLEDPALDEPEGAGREPVAIPVGAEVRATRRRGRSQDADRRPDLEDRGSRPDDRRRVPSTGGETLAQRQAVADRIARRARQVFGLTDTLAAPLTSSDSVIGAIVLSRRREGGWSATTRRILAGAAVEASSALSRAYSLRAAEAQAATDALTGLPNRRYFDEFCGLLARRRRSDDAVGVLMVDIDRFKVLNDTHGHATGDEVLRAVGGAIVARRPRGRRARPVRRRGVRRPAPEPEPGDRPRGRRAGPLVGRGPRPAPARRRCRQRVGRGRRRDARRPADRRPHRRGGPGALPGQARRPGPRRRRLTHGARPADAGRRLPSGS